MKAACAGKVAWFTSSSLSLVVSAQQERRITLSTASHDSAVLPAPGLAGHLAPIEAPPDELVEARRTPRVGPGIWGSLGWCLVFILVCQVVPGFIAGFLAGLTRLPFSHFFFPALFAGQLLGASLAILLLRNEAGRSWMAELGLNRLPLVPTLLAVLCVPGLKALCAGVALLMQWLLGRPDQIIGVVESAVTWPWWLGMLALAVGPALNEELWFRGYLGRGLLGRYGPTVGILLASVLFGLVHLSPIQGLYAVVLGVGVHLAYRATRSLWVPMLMHFLFNAQALVAVALLSGVKSEDVGTTGWAVIAAFWGVSLVLLAVAGWGLYRRRVGVAEAVR